MGGRLGLPGIAVEAAAAATVAGNSRLSTWGFEGRNGDEKCIFITKCHNIGSLQRVFTVEDVTNFHPWKCIQLPACTFAHKCWRNSWPNCAWKKHWKETLSSRERREWARESQGTERNKEREEQREGKSNRKIGEREGGIENKNEQEKARKEKQREEWIQKKKKTRERETERGE